MKSMVCNCNSYFNIDYDVPIRFEDNDYRTSTNIGLRYIPLPEPIFTSGKYVASGGGDPLLDIKYDRLKTQYSRDYHKRFMKFEGEPLNTLLMPKTHYMRSVKEQMFKNPPMPRGFPVPEYKCEYCLKKPVTLPEHVKSVEEQAVCQVSSLGRGEQPRIKVEERGIMKQLDPYVSSTTAAHVPFSKDAIFQTSLKPLTFYTAKECPELKRIKIIKPINDQLKFKKALKQRSVPTLVYRVPFTGKTSEYNSRFMPPTKNCLYLATIKSNTDVEFEDSLSNPSQWQTLAAPNMYCTEYCHIGTGRNVQRAVKVRDEPQSQYKHNYCKPLEE